MLALRVKIQSYLYAKILQMIKNTLKFFLIFFFVFLLLVFFRPVSEVFHLRCHDEQKKTYFYIFSQKYAPYVFWTKHDGMTWISIDDKMSFMDINVIKSLNGILRIEAMDKSHLMRFNNIESSASISINNEDFKGSCSKLN